MFFRWKLRGGLDAWTRAEYNRTRPDLAQRRRTGNVYLLSNNQDEGPTASIIGEMKPDVAASLLGSLPPPITAGIINELPPEKAQAVIKAMSNLTGTVEIDAEGVDTAEGTVLQYRPKDDPDDTPPAAPVRG